MAAGAVILALSATPAAADATVDRLDAATSAKNWTLASYNIGAYDYGRYRFGSGTAEQETSNEQRYWANLVNSAGNRRATSVTERIRKSIDFGGNTHRADVVAVQEATPSRVKVGKKTTTQLADLERRLDPKGTSGRGYAEAVPLSAYTGTTDTITDNGTKKKRAIDKGAHIFFNEDTLQVVARGTSLGADLIDDDYRSGYFRALGKSFPDGDDVKERAFPWAVLKARGTSSSQPNRYLVVTSMHATSPNNYRSDSTALADFYNGEIARGLTKKLQGYSNAGKAGSVTFPAGAPVVVMGDFNAYYRTSKGSFPSESSSARSVPRMLDAKGYRDARGAYFRQTKGCGSSSADCRRYATVNKKSTTGDVYDYIFTKWSGTTSNAGGFTTVADTRFYSDHRMIAARLRFAP